MSALSPAGTEVAQGCARALQKRSDNNGCAARLSPQTLLFATQSLARLYSIADDSQENACRLHPSAKANLARWACHGCPSLLVGAWQQRGGPGDFLECDGAGAGCGNHEVQGRARSSVAPLCSIYLSLKSAFVYLRSRANRQAAHLRLRGTQ
jgi:hypothetical protein